MNAWKPTLKNNSQIPHLPALILGENLFLFLKSNGLYIREFDTEGEKQAERRESQEDFDPSEFLQMKMKS